MHDDSGMKPILVMTTTFYAPSDGSALPENPPPAPARGGAQLSGVSPGAQISGVPPGAPHPPLRLGQWRLESVATTPTANAAGTIFCGGWIVRHAAGNPSATASITRRPVGWSSSTRRAVSSVGQFQADAPGRRPRRTGGLPNSWGSVFVRGMDAG